MEQEDTKGSPSWWATPCSLLRAFRGRGTGPAWHRQTEGQNGQARGVSFGDSATSVGAQGQLTCLCGHTQTHTTQGRPYPQDTVGGRGNTRSLTCQGSHGDSTQGTRLATSQTQTHGATSQKHAHTHTHTRLQPASRPYTGTDTLHVTLTPISTPTLGTGHTAAAHAHGNTHDALHPEPPVHSRGWTPLTHEHTAHLVPPRCTEQREAHGTGTCSLGAPPSR